VLYPDKVRKALEDSLVSFRELDSRHAEEIEAYAGGLNSLAGMSAAEIEALMEGKANPGALPSEEHGSPLVIPFPHLFTCHEEARAWAFERIQGITTLAVDGSQIHPSKDYSYGVAAIQVAWFENRHRGTGPGGYVKDVRFELLPPNLMLDAGEEGGGLVQEVNSRRFRGEVEEIVRHMLEWGRGEQPSVAFFDGSLVASFATLSGNAAGRPYVDALLELLSTSRERRVPAVGFVDTSYAKDLCTLLAHLGRLPLPARRRYRVFASMPAPRSPMRWSKHRPPRPRRSRHPPRAPCVAPRRARVRSRIQPAPRTPRRRSRWSAA
jgi:hypothetical protein